VANIITCIRIICSIILLFIPTFSIPFYALYLLAGGTDMIDGTVARKTCTVSEFGSKLDTVADFIFIAVCAIKILPMVDIENWMCIWIGIISVIKVINIISGFVVEKRFVAVHSVMNKITGGLLFVLPLTVKVIDLKYSAAIVCATATFAAIQEGHYIRTFKEKSIVKEGTRSMQGSLYKLLKDKKVADSYQFYTSCEYKLYFAETSFQALQNIISKYQQTETERVNKVFSDAIMTGVGKYIAQDNSVDYLGVQMDVTSVMDKLTMEIMGLLHNFFDTYAQWLNSSLLGEEALPIKRTTLVNISQKLVSYPEYAGAFVTKLSAIPNEDQYLYIADFNNTLKHRYQIYIKNRFDILAATGDVSIPPFTKDGRLHIKEDALDVLKKSLDYCKSLLEDSRTFIEQYYSTNDNNYVSHRVYNPKTYLVFESEEDYKAMRSPKNHYYYIEVDPANIPDKIQVMLSCDRMDKTDEEEKSLDCYNSPYQIIMLREFGSDKIVGLLKPDDAETYKLSDEHEIKYRQYSSVTTGYEHEMFMAICGDEKFNYYPYLSDSTIVVLKDK